MTEMGNFSMTLDNQVNGDRSRIYLRALKIRFWARPITTSPSHQPEQISMAERLCPYSPSVETPQCSTKSISTYPTRPLSQSVILRGIFFAIRLAPRDEYRRRSLIYNGLVDSDQKESQF